LAASSAPLLMATATRRTNKVEMARLRLRLLADPSRLAGFDSKAALELARPRLRQARDDAELAHVEQLAPDAVGVVLLVAPAVGADDIDEIAKDLRAALGIGPGPHELILNEAADPYVHRVRGIKGESTACPSCGLGGGRHLPGCPRAAAR